MAQAVKISDEEMGVVREAAELNSRSLSGQVEHWIRLGRAVERNPAMGYVQVEEALRGLRPVGSLSEAQQDDFLDRFSEETARPTAQELAFWSARDAAGLGVGMDESGALVRPANAKRAH